MPDSERRKWKEIKKGYTHFRNNDVIVAKITPCFENSKAGIIESLVNGYGAGTTELYVLRVLENVIDSRFLYCFIKTAKFLKNGESVMTGTAGQKRVPKEYIENCLLPLPPLSEQKLIVDKVNELMRLCYAAEKEIAYSRQQADYLLNAILRETFTFKKKTEAMPARTMQPLEDHHFVKRKVLATYIINQSLDDRQLGDTKFEKLLHLADYHAIKRNLGQAYIQKTAGPYDNAFTIPYFKQIENSKWFSRAKSGNQFVFSAGQNHRKSTNTYSYFSVEELQRVSEIINYFKKCDYEQPEIISTLYAVWNNRIIRQQPISDDLLIEDFYNWDAQKKKYKRNRLANALHWMRNKDFIPNGWGKVIEKTKKISRKHTRATN